MCKRDYKVSRKHLPGFYYDVISSNPEEFGNWAHRGCGEWTLSKDPIVLANRLPGEKPMESLPLLKVTENLQTNLPYRTLK